MATVSRRDFVIAGGAAFVGGIIGGTGVHLASSGFLRDLLSGSGRRVTVADWVDRRRAPYFIGHRGAGGVLPEHTLPSYLEALEWGAECLEISVVRSSDGVLFCHHDLTLDRTTTLQGDVRAMDASQLDTGRVRITRLGPRWAGQNMPSIPRLRDVLREVGGKAVLCIEPKDDSAYVPLVELINELELGDTVIIKLDHSSPRIEQAKESGFPVFAYLGNAEVTTETNVSALAGRLDPARDAMVLPTTDERGLMPADLIKAAVATGVPVWVFPVHRRHEVEYFAHLGVQGIITASIGYVSGAISPSRTDNWASGQLSPGELTRYPYAGAFGLAWTEPGVLTIPTPGRPTFVTFGQFAPITASSYRIAFDACFDPVPSDRWQHVSLAFGRADDLYYQHRLGAGDGYHALLRGEGHLGLYSHASNVINGRQLVAPAEGRPLHSGVWSRLTLDVTPESIRWSRDDGTAVEVRDSRFRGGYFHIGSSATDGALKLRALSVS